MIEHLYARLRQQLGYISCWPEVYPQLPWSILDSLSGRKCLFQRAYVIDGIAKQYSEESPGYVIQNWIRSRNKLEFLCQWEIVELILNRDFWLQ